jgi:hypothetical protein
MLPCAAQSMLQRQRELEAYRTQSVSRTLDPLRWAFCIASRTHTQPAVEPQRAIRIICAALETLRLHSRRGNVHAFPWRCRLRVLLLIVNLYMADMIMSSEALQVKLWH